MKILKRAQAPAPVMPRLKDLPEPPVHWITFLGDRPPRIVTRQKVPTGWAPVTNHPSQEQS